ncbi:MAG: carbohydrate ABC transporter permease, partial [Paracoccus sp. (in: a-proteobacteria)]|nr:carbohydrate ABC transporter permease [Paracoccus sp. (in: a-proteobacteria)]
AHTGFALPLAIFILHRFMARIPAQIIDSARLDGAGEFQIFRQIALPLTLPALAGFATFQFLWVWNDLLVATVFLGTSRDQLVLTGVLRELMGSRGGEWEMLAASAVITMIAPLAVFFAMQKYLVSGMLAGASHG